MNTLLYGRDAERSLIGALLEGAGMSRSGVLVIRGEAGVGKSMLLEDTLVRAPEMQLLRCVGIESEAQLPFAALDQLLRPVLGQLDKLPGPQARALRAALGLGTGGGDDRFLISLAVLSLLAEAAEGGPLLCLIDDAQWLDDASADALVFVARRLEAEGIVLLFAAREGEARQFEAPGLPELHVGGLDADAAGALLARHAGIALSQEAREQLVERTGGHPLALLELPATLTEADLFVGAALPTPVPISARLVRAFLGRARALPEDTQTLLLVAAADDTGEISTVLAAAAQLGVGAEALDAAEQAALTRVRGTQLEFHHPLVRSAVYHGAPLSRRQAAHRAIASVLDGEVELDRRAWHRAAASVAPDPSVVEELEQAAERARQRSGFATASRAFERAAVLTPDELPRARRLTSAAENAWMAGRIERARMLLERARPLATEAIEQADIDRYLGLIELAGGTPAVAHRLLFRAAEEVAPLDGERALQLLNLASIAALYAGDGDAAVAIANLARKLESEDSTLDRMLVELLVGLGAHFERDFARAAESLRSALGFEERLRESEAALADQPVAVLFAGRAALFLSDDERAYPLNQAAAARARAGGALSLLTQILPRLAHTELRVGHPASASANAAEGLRLARELGQHDLAAYGLVVQALIAAYSGAEEECRTLAAEARQLAAAHGFAFVDALADWALAHLELGLGQADEAFRRARDISTGDVAFFAALDRIEAAMRVGELDTAQTLLAAFEPWAQHGGAPWARAVALHAHALLAEDDKETERLFEAALAVHAEGSRPYERARTELAYGEFLRRGRRRLDAREHLRTALDAFERLGAALWAERARVELRASGQTARKRDPSTRGQLTAQELQIAQFVAQGLSNREVAAQLFLSPRTVAFHLRNVFRKLGLSSRTQLAHLDLEGGDEADGRERLIRQGGRAAAA